jgi:UDP-N-acetylmuramoyl-tripeptide--D-alanyl-D-alanine ligase
VAHILISVGPRGKYIAEEALAVGMPPQRVFITKNSEEAISLLERITELGDFILVKGSRGVEMDRIVAALGRD